MSKKSTKVIPDGMHSVTPVMYFNGNCRQAIDLYKKALGAEVVGKIYNSPDGKYVWHAMIKIGNANIMVSDVLQDHTNQFAWQKDKTATMGIWIYDVKCDELHDKAVKNGFKSTMPMSDMFWGDRFGQLQDPYGYRWSLAVHQWDYTPEEMKEKEKEAMANMQM